MIAFDSVSEEQKNTTRLIEYFFRYVVKYMKINSENQKVKERKDMLSCSEKSWYLILIKKWICILVRKFRYARNIFSFLPFYQFNLIIFLRSLSSGLWGNTLKVFEGTFPFIGLGHFYIAAWRLHESYFSTSLTSLIGHILINIDILNAVYKSLYVFFLLATLRQRLFLSHLLIDNSWVNPIL